MPAVLLALGDTQVQAQQNGDLVVVTVPSLQRLGVTLRPAAAPPSPPPGDRYHPRRRGRPLRGLLLPLPRLRPAGAALSHARGVTAPSLTARFCTEKGVRTKKKSLL